MAQAGTYTYNAAQVISDYLKSYQKYVTIPSTFKRFATIER